MSNFSSAIRITNLDDFIPQSQSCIKPVKLDNKPIPTSESSKHTIEFDEQSNTYYEISLAGEKKELEKTSISLSDCLACSGCITSAEEVLVNHQSLDRLLKELKERSSDEVWILTLSSQSRASLASKYGLNMEQVFGKIMTALKNVIGFDYVFDANWARNFTLLEIQDEFLKRKQQQLNAPKNALPNLPLLASSCPGWICYAEKTQDEDIVGLISSTKSPQAVMGSLVKGYFYEKELKPKGVELKNVRHITVMPCFDKKLEASRGEFKTPIDSQETDLVLTTTELDELFQHHNVHLKELEEQPLNSSFIDRDEKTGKLRGIAGGSGGYAESIFRMAAKKLYNVEVGQIEKKQKRNSDFQEFSLKVDGKVVLSFAQAYGFRNIQNIIRKIQHKNPRLRCKYDFVEVMACPSGCNNGGGQIAADPEKMNPRKQLEQVEELYHSVQLDQSMQDVDQAPTSIREGYQHWVQDSVGSQKSQGLLHTTYRNKNQMETPALREEW
uniref:Iron hydrogenase large subunit C-terminal domain-containing protein n=1 Tax=Percolomonas cosmopolitus TaxID=63605 RepID=A0A7S1PFX3_9EUKA